MLIFTIYDCISGKSKGAKNISIADNPRISSYEGPIAAHRLGFSGKI